METTVKLAQESSLPKIIEASSHDASADIATEGSLYQALECRPDGQPGGILMTSVGQQVLPNVWLGNYRALEDQDFLRKNKISHILTLGHFKNQYPPSMYIHKIIPVADNPEANIIQFFPVTNEFIEEAIEGHHRLLVHCLAGVSRSPTVLAAYLMHKHRLRPKEALAIIRQARPFVNPNPGFMEQLRLYREMGFEYNPQHPEFIEFHKRHPLNADHAGHEEYAAKRTIRN